MIFIKTILTGIVFVCSVGHADMFRSTLFSFNTIYMDRDYNDNGTMSSEKITDTDLRLTRIERYWAYGVTYAQSANDSSNASRTSYGISVAYFSERDFYLSYTHFLSSKYSFSSNNEYTKGNGYEFDIGFLSKITSSFYAGIMVGIKSFNYTEQTTNGARTTVNSSHHEVLPMFSFAVNLM